MSHDLSSTAELCTVPHDPVGLIEKLAGSGLSLWAGGYTSYTDVGDLNDFRYIDAPIDDLPKVKEIMRKKVAANEFPVISVTFSGTEVGGHLLFYFAEKKIHFVWIFSAKELPGPEAPGKGIPDLAWYNTRLKEVFSMSGLETTAIYTEWWDADHNTNVRLDAK